MRLRTFNGQADLVEMQAILMERTRVMGPCTNLHPGDVAHRIYGGSRMHDLDSVIPVFENGAGIAGFGIASPKDQWFDAVTRIGIDEADRMTIIDRVAERAASNGRVGTDVIGNDPVLCSVLSEMGFHPRSADYVFTQQHLDMPVTVPPHDFTIRSVSVDDAPELAAVHSGAFGSRWTSGQYAERMSQPGYDANAELVAVDSDGRFMGFTIMWCDDVNMVGYFEPVGVDKDFRRRGVGSALLLEGMSRMRFRGMTRATVWYAKSEERAVQFYRSNGFEVCSLVTGWERTMINGPIPVIR